MTEAEAEALHQILLKHWDDDEDEHAYTTKESMQDALAKAFELGRNAKSPEVDARLRAIAGRLNGIANAMASRIVVNGEDIEYWRREIEAAYDIARSEPQR